RSASGSWPVDILGLIEARMPAATRAGTASATTAPTATTAAPTQTAGTSPFTYAWGLLYEPLAEKIEARTATPNTPPTSRMALLAPDAFPSSSGRTADRTTLAIGAKNMPIPTPLTTNAGTNAA